MENRENPANHENENIPILLRIDCVFNYLDGRVIENDTAYHIRQRLAQMFHECNFGNVIQNENDLFVNEFAGPFLDEIMEDENRLFIAYSLNYPLLVGDLNQLVTNGVTNFLNEISQTYHIHSEVRFFFIK